MLSTAPAFAGHGYNTNRVETRSRNSQGDQARPVPAPNPSLRATRPLREATHSSGYLASPKMLDWTKTMSSRMLCYIHREDMIQICLFCSKKHGPNEKA